MKDAGVKAMFGEQDHHNGELTWRRIRRTEWGDLWYQKYKSRTAEWSQYYLVEHKSGAKKQISDSIANGLISGYIDPDGNAIPGIAPWAQEEESQVDPLVDIRLADQTDGALRNWLYKKINTFWNRGEIVNRSPFSVPHSERYISFFDLSMPREHRHDNPMWPVIATDAANYVVNSGTEPDHRALQTGWVDVTRTAFVEFSNVTLLMLPECYGLLLKDETLLVPQMHGFCGFMAEQVMKEALKDLASRTVSREPIYIEGASVVPVRMASREYFHFMTGTLSLICAATDSLPPLTKLLLPRGESFFDYFPQHLGEAAIELVTGGRGDVRRLVDGIYKLERVYVPSKWVFGDLSFLSNMLRFLDGVVLAGNGSRAYKEVVYVAVGTQGDRNDALNDLTVQELRRRFGDSLTIADMSNLNLIQQAAMIRCAKVVISRTSTALTNIMFAKSGSTIVEIASRDGGSEFRDLAFLLHLRYGCFITKQESDIDVSQLINFVDNLLLDV